ncbi:MAG: hypothetical protein RIT45_3197 [Pseudomonadota bacterium]|jgi:ABC-2 type transport system ATP-binding protein
MIRARALSKFYGEHAAVHDLGFEIAGGECVGFLGLNGAGKSTTLRMLAGVLEPSAGRLEIDTPDGRVAMDADADASSIALRRHIGYLPERPPLYDEMTPRAFLRYAAALRDVPAGEREQASEDALRRCGLLAVAEAPIGTLSHGFRQRVGIAQAIVHRPALLILDEPTQGLDPVQTAGMRELLRELRGRHTILLSTHILGEIEATCDRILLLHEGRLHAEGDEQTLVTRFADGGRLRFELRGDAESIGRCLQAVTGVREVRTMPADATAASVVVEVAADDDVRAAAVAALVGAGVDVLGLRRAQSGLEGVFLGLGGGGAA